MQIRSLNIKAMINPDRNKKRMATTRTAAGILLISVLFFIGLAGCRKDFQFDKVRDLTWNPELAFAVVSDTINVRRILTQGKASDNLYIDESGNISILYYYNNDAFRIRPNDLLRISMAEFNYRHQITQTEKNILLVSDLEIPAVPVSINLNVNNPEIRIDQLTIKEGYIWVATENTFSNEGYITIKVLNATRNGEPFSFTLSPLEKGLWQKPVDISGVTFDFSQSPNVLNLTVEALLKRSSEPVAGDDLSAGFKIFFDNIGSFRGFLGHQVLDQLKDTVKVSVFNNAYTLGEIYFIDPQATITIVNSIGIPTIVTIERLVAVNHVTGSTLDIADRLGSGSVIDIPSPDYPLVNPAVKSMGYSNENTGNAMHDFFNMKPDDVAFQIRTEINPQGTPLNFFSDTSSFFADLRIKLPLWGHVDHLTYQDTFDLDVDKPDELEYLEFKTRFENGLPLTGHMQIYFTDDQYHIKDSLAGQDPILIRSAPVDPNTFLPYPGAYSTKDTVYILSTDRMKNFENVKKMIFKGVLFSGEEGYADVKLRANQAIRLNFAARAKVRKTIDFNK